ncbi:MAG: hypothetical protein MJ252_04305 [archaeon]|nr:hypothetical protein [archaeon]
MQAIAYCFDYTNKQSFANLENWMKEVKKYGGDKLIPILIGLKSDMTRMIDFGQITAFAQKNKMNFFETSIKDVYSIKKFFIEFGNVLYDYISSKKR